MLKKRTRALSRRVTIRFTKKTKSKVNKESNKAEKEADKSYAHTEAENTQGELESLGNAAGDVHKSCDFTLKNFAVRQEARDQEVNALRQAKSILSGANFGAFLQQRV